MAGKGGSVEYSIVGKFDPTAAKAAQREIGTLDQNIAGFKNSVTEGFLGPMAKMGAAIGGALAVEKVVDFFKSSAEAAIEDEKALRSLEVTLGNVGSAMPVKEVDEFLQRLALSTGVTKDEMVPAFQKVVTATGDAAKAQSALSLAMDVTAGTPGKDLMTVTTALSKAYSGNTTALGRLGAGIDANIIKSKDMGKITEALTAKFKGQAAAAGETMAGSLAKMSVAATEAKEAIGYALLDTVKNITEALGTTSTGATGAIIGFGDGIAAIIRQSGEGVTALAKLASGLKSAGEAAAGYIGASGLFDSALSAAWTATVNFAGGPLYMLGGAFDSVQDKSAALGSRIDATSASMKAATAMGIDYASATRTAAQVTQDEADAVKEVDDRLKEFLGTISASQKLDDLKTMMRDLGKTLKGLGTDMLAPTNAAAKMRTELRNELSAAASIVQGWVDSGKISANQFDQVFGNMRKNIINGFVNHGVDRSTIVAFLGKSEIWTQPMDNAVKVAVTAVAASAKVVAQGIGTALTTGVAAGIYGGQAKVNQAARQIIADAEREAKLAAESKSPSKVFARIGGDLASGLAKGVTDNSAKATAAAVKMISDTATAAAAKGREMVTAAWGEVQSAYDAAVGNIDSFVSSAKDRLMSGIDLGSAWSAQWNSNGEATGASFLDGINSMVAKFDLHNSVLLALKKNGASDALLEQVASQSQDIGTAMGQGILDQGLIPTLNSKLASVTNAASDTANAMVPSFLLAGAASAAATVQSFVQMFGQQGPARTALMSLMDELAGSLARTVPITVQVAQNVVAGVTAAAASIVGVSSGGATPAVSLPSATTRSATSGQSSYDVGGRQIVVNMNGVVGDPRLAGQQIAEVLRKFEKANGPVWTAA